MLKYAVLTFFPCKRFILDTSVEVVVIGGGLSGLSACSQLTKSGVSVVLVEAANYLGNS